MLTLFEYGRNSLDRLLFPEIAMWECFAYDGIFVLEYYHKDSGYFVDLRGDERADYVFVRSRLPLSAVEYLSIDPVGRTMVIMQDDGSTRHMDSELKILYVGVRDVYVETAQLTDTSTVDCFLKAFVQAVKNGE
jgi:hypothetical protein